MLRFVGIFFLAFLLPLGVHAEGRLALLIGNQTYSETVGPLKNPHNDVALVGAALERIGFKVTSIKDAGYRAIDTALKRHIQQVRRAGKDTISFVYYSGHGAADPDTQVNYLIPIDVTNADDREVWTNSLDLKEIVSRLREQAPDAVHYVIFDACREELRLTRDGKKALERKGFVPVASISGVMVAYATAPGKTASDTGDGGGVYAKALAEEIVKPGIESVMMFRNVQLKVKESIGQDPWLSFPTLPAVYFAGTKPTALTPEQQLELAFWLSVKDSTNPAVLGAYLERYPNGEFAPVARSLVEHYERKLKAELAAQEEKRKRREEEWKAAEVKRLEQERSAREAALAEERRKAEESKSDPEMKRMEEEQRAELIRRTEELRNAVEEARRAREAAKTAEEQRLAAVRAAEEATRQAEQAIALKRDSERHTDPTKVAILPKLEKSSTLSGFDGAWNIVRLGQNCRDGHYTFVISISGGVISGRAGHGTLRGSVAASGTLRFTHPSYPRGGPKYYSGTLRDSRGSGTFTTGGGNCTGTFTASRG